MWRPPHNESDFRSSTFAAYNGISRAYSSTVPEAIGLYWFDCCITNEYATLASGKHASSTATDHSKCGNFCQPEHCCDSCGTAINNNFSAPPYLPPFRRRDGDPRSPRGRNFDTRAPQIDGTMCSSALVPNPATTGNSLPPPSAYLVMNARSGDDLNWIAGAQQNIPYHYSTEWETQLVQDLSAEEEIIKRLQTSANAESFANDWMRKPFDFISKPVPERKTTSESQSLCTTFCTNLGSYSTSTLANAGVRSIASSTVVWSTVWTPDRKQWYTCRTIECDCANLGNADPNTDVALSGRQF